MRATCLRPLNAIALAVALAVGTVSVGRDVQAQTQAADSRRYDIPAGKLADGLKQLGMQSRLQLLAPPELTKDRRGKSVTGTYTAEQALEQLLAGSGLSYEFVNASTVVIKKAQVTAPAAAKQPIASASSEAKTLVQPEPATLEGTTVTGTRIRGGSTPSPVIAIGAADIREAGFSDLGEVIRSVPQNFSGGQNPGVVNGTASSTANQNITGGSGLNLRGLGPDATLTLLNGRRMSYGGYAQSVDISAIPVEAVERIEIVADGASAVYGSDAVAGVGNVILKRDFDGVTVGARYGDATDGGLTTRDYTATAGAAWTSGGLIATYKDASVDPIYADQRGYTDQMDDPTTIYPGSDLRSGLFSAYQALGAAVELRLDVLRTEREQYIYAARSASYTYATPATATSLVSPSVEISLPSDWTLSLGGSWGKDEIEYKLSTVTVATGASMLSAHYCYCNESRSYEASAEGPLFMLGGGEARLAAGVGYRHNDFVNANYTRATRDGGDESSRFAYLELNLPLIGSASNRAGVRRLELTAALRGEDYDSFGGVTTPKFGVIYDPGADFTLKASWGKSFKTPTLLQRYQVQTAYLDPPSYYGGTGYPPGSTVLTAEGGNPELGAERARTRTVSLTFHPEALHAADLELSWFDIDYTDRAVRPVSNTSQGLSNPIYAEFVNYSPTLEQQTSIIATSQFYNFSGAAYDAAKVIAILSNRYVNVARQRIEGIDFSGSYALDVYDGQLAIRGSATWLDSSQQNSAGQASIALAGTLFNPARLNSRVGAVWDRANYAVAAFANYTGGVTSNVIAGSTQKTASFTTFDLNLRYRTGERGKVWSGLELALSAQNLFDRSPPLHRVTSLAAVPYDSTNYTAIGRFLGVAISKHW